MNRAQTIISCCPQPDCGVVGVMIGQPQRTCPFHGAYDDAAIVFTDFEQLQWHPDPASKRYGSTAKAQRACDWLNWNYHWADRWKFRPGPPSRDGSVRLERRYVG